MPHGLEGWEKQQSPDLGGGVRMAPVPREAATAGGGRQLLQGSEAFLASRRHPVPQPSSSEEQHVIPPKPLLLLAPPIKQGPRGSLALSSPGRASGLQPWQEPIQGPSPLGELPQTQLPSAARPPGVSTQETPPWAQPPAPHSWGRPPVKGVPASPRVSLRRPPGEGARRGGNTLGQRGLWLLEWQEKGARAASWLCRVFPLLGRAAVDMFLKQFLI